MNELILNKDDVKTILEDTFENYYEDNVLRGATTEKKVFIHRLKTELENYPNVFNSFFEASWEELTTSKRDERKEIIFSIFE